MSVPVTAPVFAEVGPVYLRLFPAVEDFSPPDESYSRPWAWGALCHVRFIIGELRVTKKVTTKFAYEGDERPDDISLANGRAYVLANLRSRLARHGFEPPELVVVELETGMAVVPDMFDGVI